LSMCMCVCMELNHCAKIYHAQLLPESMRPLAARHDVPPDNLPQPLPTPALSIPAAPSGHPAVLEIDTVASQGLKQP